MSGFLTLNIQSRTRLAPRAARIHYNQGAELLDYVHNAGDFAMDGGYIEPLPLPGLGVDVNEERVMEASQAAPDWRNPLWRHADGSVAEW